MFTLYVLVEERTDILSHMHSSKTCSLQVDFNAATEYDAMNNYKVLQAAFAKMGIDKASHLPSACRAPLPSSPPSSASLDAGMRTTLS